MTPEAQRIAIAEVCPTLFRVMRESKDLCWKPPGSEYEQDVDPLNDLNAMHEAEKVLIDKQHSEYRGKLVEVCESLADALCATAAQRAEALLRTLRLWKEESQ